MYIEEDNVVKINSNEELIYEQYFSLVNPLFGKNKLSKTEIKVLSKFYQVYFRYHHLGEKIVKDLLFHSETRLRIRQAVGRDLNTTFSKYSMNNTVYWLRRKGFISKGNELVHRIPMKSKTIDVNIRFKLVDNDK
jgi:hypothetical protein